MYENDRYSEAKGGGKYERAEKMCDVQTGITVEKIMAHFDLIYTAASEQFLIVRLMCLATIRDQTHRHLHTTVQVVARLHDYVYTIDLVT